jgi:ribosome-associated protein YbcJ (S4-like RNA binding protein)
LGQFLKLVNIIADGGAAKYFLGNHDILVEGVAERRRGKKLYPGMTIEALGLKYLIAAADENR